jgi:uncharacterized delta-60 repeat protein
MIARSFMATVKHSEEFYRGFLSWGRRTSAAPIPNRRKSICVALFPFTLKTRAGLLLLAVAFASPAMAQTPDSFNPTASNTVYAIAFQTDGGILLGGNFTSVAGQPRNYLARLNPDGTLDDSFDPAPSGFVETLAIQPDGQILVGGGFTSIGLQPRRGIARLSPAGAVDGGFNPGAEYGEFVGGIVHALALQPNGQIVVGGLFTKLGGQWRTNIARLNPDGSTDLSFNPSARATIGIGDVLSVSLQADGKILAGGSFSSLAGQLRNGFGRLEPGGVVDTSFDPKPNGRVHAIAVQPDGLILVGGSFTNIGGQPRNRIARLGTNGVVDPTFNPGASGNVHTIVIQADGRILVGGSFTNLAGQSRTNIGRLNQPGTLDATFDTSANDRVLSLAVQPDGKVLVGGDFTNLGGKPRAHIGRLSNPQVATQNLVLDATGLTWSRDGSAPEFWRTSFDHSTNGLDWTSVGNGTHTPGGWQLGLASLLSKGVVRARGFVTSGEWSGSSWFVESLLTVSPAQPIILVKDGNFGVRSNGFGFNVCGTLGQIVVLEASSNFVDWLGLATNSLVTNPFYFSDPNSQSLAERYYRLRVQ